MTELSMREAYGRALAEYGNPAPGSGGSGCGYLQFHPLQLFCGAFP